LNTYESAQPGVAVPAYRQAGYEKKKREGLKTLPYEGKTKSKDKTKGPPVKAALFD
jgi:hypothetical protein